MNEPSEQPASNPAPLEQFTGTLRGGILAIGAETTGWQLETDEGRRLDVNLSNVTGDANDFDGKRVIIHGRLTTARWSERGDKKLLMAHRIEPAE